MSTQAPSPRRFGGRPIHVLLVDDHPAVRQGVRQLLATQGELDTVLETSSASDATSELARWADVAVIDYHLGDRDGLWLTHKIKRLPSAPPVLIYSAFADPRLAAASIIAGADGLLSKTAGAADLFVTIRRLLHGRKSFPAIPKALDTALRSRLAPRDRAIYSMLIHDVAPEDISRRLGITPVELQERRRAIVSAIAPTVAVASLSPTTRAPLDYERARRRHRYGAAG
jgi:DNA-binding NarL/FixJ family response regulator